MLLLSSFYPAMKCVVKLPNTKFHENPFCDSTAVIQTGTTANPGDELLQFFLANVPRKKLSGIRITITPWFFSPLANYTDRAIAAGQRS
jgi:hypothetical protein